MSDVYLSFIHLSLLFSVTGLTAVETDSVGAWELAEPGAGPTLL